MSEVTEHNEVTQEPEPSSFRLIFSLGTAGFFAGLLLVSAFIYTLPLIEANKAEALQRAIFKVLPGCETFITLEMVDNKLIEVSESGPGSGETSKGSESSQVFAGYDNSGSLIGFAIPGSEPGFQDIIGAIYGYDAAGEVIIGFEVLESKETPGLGDKIFKDPDFQTNFTRLSVEPEILAVKKGKKKNANEVEAITGATISSKAIVRLLNNGMNEWKQLITAYLQENDVAIAGQKQAHD